jgi:formate hydrogenlyase subunit 6/NADH:ubiquinone oxidoreductase subunit I
MLSTTPAFDMQWRVLLGVHTCDLHAINLLGAAFGKGNADAHYLKRRATTLIVSLECLQPCDEHSFCKSMDTLSASRGFDLHMIDLGDAYAVEVGSRAGDALLTNHAHTRDMTRDEMRLLNRALTAKWEHFPRKLNIEARELPALMALSYHSPLWDELGKKCLSCAACNLVCPTCYCFDVRENIALNGKTGERVRVWDSCQLPQFAAVATGENFRKTSARRLRHRFFRKGKYISDMFPGELGCVGCGRCARSCLVHISPVNVWNDLAKVHAV